MEWHIHPIGERRHHHESLLQRVDCARSDGELSAWLQWNLEWDERRSSKLYAQRRCVQHFVTLMKKGRRRIATGHAAPPLNYRPGKIWSFVSPGLFCGLWPSYTTRQGVPLSVNALGALLLPLQEPLKPGGELSVAPGAIVALYDRLVMVTLAPDCV